MYGDGRQTGAAKRRGKGPQTQLSPREKTKETPRAGKERLPPPATATRTKPS